MDLRTQFFCLFLINTIYAKCDLNCQEECLVYHNKYRLNHNTSTLVYDDKLAHQAQSWADSGNVGSSIWGNAERGGECWAWGNIFPSWKAVIKTWHDQERHFDWNTFQSKNGEKVGCFQQILWASAKKLGCGVGIVNGLPFYVAHMDVPGVIKKEIHNHGPENIKTPLLPDLEWFEGDLDLLPNPSGVSEQYNSNTKSF
ncbi:uncharacterized protein LOC136085462 isoform X2 [Hydra vulgaris]|uniref:Uncharacterized protein LOC136085462 isoform X2 n=1 Tax=Hydra vulgaris TaxID=6087 RepID=A0ABM4CM06_HYDVU